MQISASDKDYHLWQHEQLIVLLSRVRKFHNMFFVGDTNLTKEQIKEDTLKGIEMVLNHNSVWTQHIAATLEYLNYIKHPGNSTVVMRKLRFFNHEMPPDVGFAYLLVSQKQNSYGYVGETSSISRRLREHNSKQGGSKATHHNALKPFVPVVLVCGFPGIGTDPENRAMRKKFERKWHLKNAQHMSQHGSINSKVLYDNGFFIYNTMKQKYHRQLKNLQWLCQADISLVPEGEDPLPIICFTPFKHSLIFHLLADEQDNQMESEFANAAAAYEHYVANNSTIDDSD